MNKIQKEWNRRCKFYSWECEYPYYNEYCTNSNHFALKRKTCKGCKGFIDEVE